MCVSYFIFNPRATKWTKYPSTNCINSCFSNTFATIHQQWYEQCYIHSPWIRYLDFRCGKCYLQYYGGSFARCFKRITEVRLLFRLSLQKTVYVFECAYWHVRHPRPPPLGSAPAPLTNCSTSHPSPPIANNSNNFAYPRPFYFLLQLTFIFGGLYRCCTGRSTFQATAIVVLQIVPAGVVYWLYLARVHRTKKLIYWRGAICKAFTIDFIYLL